MIIEYKRSDSGQLSRNFRLAEFRCKCKRCSTVLVDTEPEAAPALRERVCESYAGTEDDPIPYSGNMSLESGKYYHQNYVL